MFHSLRTAVEIVYSTADIWTGLPYVLAASGVLVGGSIVWMLFILLLQCLLVRKERAEDLVAFDTDKSGLKRERRIFEKKPSRTCGNYVQFVIQTIMFVGFAMIFWIAFASAGFNVWTTAAASLGLSLIGTYGLMTPLSLLLNGYVAVGARSVIVGEHVEFYGMGDEWAGRIISINHMSVIMARYCDKTKSDELITMPISRFLDTPHKQNFKKQMELDKMYSYPQHLVQYDYNTRRRKLIVQKTVWDVPQPAPAAYNVDDIKV